MLSEAQEYAACQQSCPKCTEIADPTARATPTMRTFFLPMLLNDQACKDKF